MKITKFLRWFFVFTILLNCMLTLMSAVEAKSSPSDALLFDKLFADWTQAFNSKNLQATSNLFSKDCVSSNPGAPHGISTSPKTEN